MLNFLKKISSKACMNLLFFFYVLFGYAVFMYIMLYYKSIVFFGSANTSFNNFMFIKLFIKVAFGVFRIGYTPLIWSHH